MRGVEREAERREEVRGACEREGVERVEGVEGEEGGNGGAEWGAGTGVWRLLLLLLLLSTWGCVTEHGEDAEGKGGEQCGYCV